MLRRSNSKYCNGRSNDLLKVKTRRDDEGIVLSYESGHGKHSGRLGALRLLNRAGKKFKVGSGFSDEQRENPPPLGSVVTYRYSELTLTGIPRFPVFSKERPDINANDPILQQILPKSDDKVSYWLFGTTGHKIGADVADCDWLAPS